MAERAGDWQCPNQGCVNNTKMVFGSKANCPKCGYARDDAMTTSQIGPPAGAYGPQPQGGLGGIGGMGGMGGNGGERAERGMQGGDMPGDWQCPNPNCINHSKLVFAKHQSCPSCSTARNAKQPGDWLCPNSQCLNHKNTVFASKVMCPKCGSPRPGAVQPIMTMPLGGMGGFGGCGMGVAMGPGRSRGMSPAVHAQVQAQAMMQQMLQQQQQQQQHHHQPINTGNPADWRCPNPNCLNNTKMVFAKHQSCPKCGQTKPMVHQQPMGGMGQMGGLASLGMGGMGGMAMGPMPVMKGRGGSNPGDWRCPNPDCLNHRNQVFAKHATCPNCGTEKPGVAGGVFGESGRSRSPHRMNGGGL